MYKSLGSHLSENYSYNFIYLMSWKKTRWALPKPEAMQNLSFQKSYGNTHSNITRLFLKPGKQPNSYCLSGLNRVVIEKSYGTDGSQDSNSQSVIAKMSSFWKITSRKVSSSYFESMMSNEILCFLILDFKFVCYNLKHVCVCKHVVLK